MSFRLTKATDDIFEVGGQEAIVIRGVLDPECLHLIKVGPYQREVMTGHKAKSLARAFGEAPVADIELGLRSDKYRVSDGGIMHLHGDVYVIDGLQRVSAAITLMQQDASAKPHIGAQIHVDTTEEWETERFRVLNQERSKLSSNILLRNLRGKSEAVAMMHKLCEDTKFALCNRVQWSQRRGKSEITTAMVLVQVAGYLHTRFGPGRGNTNPTEIAVSLDNTMNEVGRTTMRDNLITFFDLVDECFGIRRCVYHQGATFVRRNFLVCLADLFTKHDNFWKGKRLFVDKPFRRKISKFQINDPEVTRLASAGGSAKEILYHLMLSHVNSGKRTNRLVSTDQPDDEGPGDDTELAQEHEAVPGTADQLVAA